jgi:hypothetical protein
LTGNSPAPILWDMLWRALWRQSGPVQPMPIEPQPRGDEDLRLFPIVGPDACYPVAALLARGRLEEAGELVPARAWVASTPLYG